MKVQRTSVGLDVHARSVVACGLDGDTGEVFQRRLSPDYRVHHRRCRFRRPNAAAIVGCVPSRSVRRAGCPGVKLSTPAPSVEGSDGAANKSSASAERCKCCCCQQPDPLAPACARPAPAYVCPLSPFSSSLPAHIMGGKTLTPPAPPGSTSQGHGEDLWHLWGRYPRPHGENKQRRWRGYRRVESAESGNDPAVVIRDSTPQG